MNKLKRCAIVALCILSLAICAVFGGCSESYTVVSEGHSVENGIIRYYVSVSLNSGEYEVDFTVCSRDRDGKVIDEASFRKTVEVGSNNFIYISAVFESSSPAEVYKVNVEKMKATKRNKSRGVEIIAVVGGSLSAAVITGLVVLFVLDKKGKLKK